MKISHEPINETSTRLQVTISAEEVKDSIQQRLKEFGKRANIPGFRAGKTPTSIIEKKYGQGIRYDLVQRKVYEGINEYLKEQKIKTIGGIIITEDNNGYTAADSEFAYEATVGLAPDIQNPFNDQVSLPYYLIETNEDKITEVIEGAQRSFGERIEVEGDIQEDDMLYVSAREVDHEGTPVEGGVDLKETYMMVKYIPSEEVKESLLKAHKGDTMILDLQKTFAGTLSEIASFLQITSEEVANHSNHTTITINKILRVEPHAIDEQLIKLILGEDTVVKTEEELRTELRHQQSKYYADLSDALFTSEVSAQIMELAKDLPLSAPHVSMLLKGQEEESREELEARTDRMLPYIRYRYIVEELASQLNAEVTEMDVKQELSKIVARQLRQMGLGQLLSNQQFMDRIMQQRIADRSPELQEAEASAQESAVARKVRELVKITEHTIQESEFTSLQEEKHAQMSKLLENEVEETVK